MYEHSSGKMKVEVIGKDYFGPEGGAWFPPELKSVTGKDSNNLFRSMRLLLRFGNTFGLFPFQNLWQGDPTKVSFRLSSFSAFWGMIPSMAMLIGMLHSSVALGTITGDAGKWAFSSENLVFYICGFLVYTHFLRHGQRYTHIWRKWNAVPTRDPTLQRDTHLLCLIFVSGMLENMVWTYSTIMDWEDSKGPRPSSMWENVYRKTGPHVIPYHPTFSMYFLLANKYGMWGWTLADVFLTVICRGMYGKFKAFNKRAVEELRNASHGTISILLEEHRKLRTLFLEIKDLVSPIVFILYGTNLFFLSLKIHLAITENKEKSWWGSIYAVWAFMHLLAKLYLLTVLSSRIQTYIQKFGDLLQDLPVEFETTMVERTRTLIQSRKFKLDGLGCFTISRPLLLKMFSFVFTFEIVLLQSSLQHAPLRNISSSIPSAQIMQS